jgi:hypothetical protein
LGCVLLLVADDPLDFAHTAALCVGEDHATSGIGRLLDLIYQVVQIRSR